MLRTLTLALVASTGIAGVAQAQISNAGFGATENQVSVGLRLDAATPTPSNDLIGARANLVAATPADRQTALVDLGAGGLSLLPELTARVNEFQEQGLRRYLRDFRAGGTGVEGRAGDAKPSSRVFGSFLTGQATTGSYDGNTDRNRSEFGTQGGMGGLDLRFGGRSLIGAYGGYQNMDASLSANSRRSRIQSWFAGGYGTFGLGPLYVDLFGSYGESNIDLYRGINFGSGLAVPATELNFFSETKARTWLAGGTVGLSFNFAGFEFEPFAGARYTDLKVRGINEGPGFGAIAIGPRGYESVLSNIGLRVGGAFAVRGATVRPEVRGAWRREWLDPNNRGFAYSIAGTGASTPAYFVPTRPGRDYASVGAGFTVSGAGSPLSFVVDYNGEFDADRDVHGITGGVRLTF